MYYMVFKNLDALLQLPTEVKTLILLCLLVSLGLSLLKQIGKLIEFVIVAFVIYFLLTRFGVI